MTHKRITREVQEQVTRGPVEMTGLEIKNAVDDIVEDLVKADKRYFVNYGDLRCVEVIEEKMIYPEYPETMISVLIEEAAPEATAFRGKVEEMFYTQHGFTISVRTAW